MTVVLRRDPRPSSLGAHACLPPRSQAPFPPTNGGATSGQQRWPSVRVRLARSQKKRRLSKTPLRSRSSLQQDPLSLPKRMVPRATSALHRNPFVPSGHEWYCGRDLLHGESASHQRRLAALSTLCKSCASFIERALSIAKRCTTSTKSFCVCRTN